MLIRALVAWCGLLLLAVGNGAFREGVLLPRYGEAVAHRWSTLMLAGLILAAALPLEGWIRPPDGRTALAIGGLWLVLTLVFEFVGGHFLFRRPWSALLAEYDLTRGRIWVLVLVVTTLAPSLWHSRH